MWMWLRRVLRSEHKWAADQLSAYLDNELSGRDRARVDAHLGECSTCAEELGALRWTVELTTQMPRLRAPHSFVISDAVPRPSWIPYRLAYLYLRGATAAVAALLLLVLGSDLAAPSVLRHVLPAAGVVRHETVAEVEEVYVEKAVERELPTASPTLPAARALAKAPVTVPVSEESAAEEREQAGDRIAEKEKEPVAETGKAPLVLMAPAAEPAVVTDSTLGASREAVERGTVLAEAAVAPPTVAFTATHPPVSPTPTPLPSRAPAPEVEPSPPQPTRSSVVVTVTVASEPDGGASPPWRPALRGVEMGLALLALILMASTVVLRTRLQ